MSAGRATDGRENIDSAAKASPRRCTKFCIDARAGAKNPIRDRAEASAAERAGQSSNCEIIKNHLF